jgi:hypothetical protein
MRPDLLRSIVLGLCFGAFPAAHAAQQKVVSTKRDKTIVKKGNAKVKASLIVKAKKSDVEAARNSIQMTIELTELSKSPSADNLTLLITHQHELEGSSSSAFVPLKVNDNETLGVEYGRINIKDAKGNGRNATAEDLQAFGVFGKADFERVVAQRLDEVASESTLVKGKTAADKVRNDLDLTRALMSAVSYTKAIKSIAAYHKDVLVASGRAESNEHIVLAANEQGALVIANGSVVWKDVEKGATHTVRRQHLESLGVKSVDDFTRIATTRLVKQLRIKGATNEETTLKEADEIYRRELEKVQALAKLTRNALDNADLALVLRSRRLLNKPSPIVLLKGQDETLELTEGTLRVKKEGAIWPANATVADLRRFGIESLKDFEKVAAAVLANEVKKDAK